MAARDESRRVVIAGHFAFAAAVKSRERTVPLWALMLATQWLDVVFVPLFVRGIERIQIVSGLHAGYGTGIIYADYTHSLLGALLLAATFGLVSSMHWGRRAGVVLGGVVFSHWLIDLVVHRSDMPFLPGNMGSLPRVGFGLWRAPIAAGALESALVVFGAYLYWRAARDVSKTADRAIVRRANVVGALVLVGGFVVLAMDVLGI